MQTERIMMCMRSKLGVEAVLIIIMGDPQIYVRGFPKYTTEEELRSIFGAYGDIREIRMIRDYAFIVPPTPCRSSREKMPPGRQSTK